MDFSYNKNFTVIWKCENCGKENSDLDPSWRMGLDGWEHQCGEPQAGHFQAKPLEKQSVDK